MVEELFGPGMILGQYGLAVSASVPIDEIDGLFDRIHYRNGKTKIKKLLMEILIPGRAHLKVSEDGSGAFVSQQSTPFICQFFSTGREKFFGNGLFNDQVRTALCSVGTPPSGLV